ncbi:MAG: hypothetical protein ABIH20_00515 [Candidatus Diapherotrites archaeon]
MRKDLEHTFSEYLDKEMQNKLFVRFVFSEDFNKIDAFAVSLISTIREKPREIIRFDASIRERINVHKFYSKPIIKQYLNKEKCFKTLEEFIENIRENWIIYRLEYEENY